MLVKNNSAFHAEWHLARCIEKNDENYFLNKLPSVKNNSFDKIKIILFLSLNLPIIPIKEAPFITNTSCKFHRTAKSALKYQLLACLKTHPTTLFEKILSRKCHGYFLVPIHLSFVLRTAPEESMTGRRRGSAHQPSRVSHCDVRSRFLVELKPRFIFPHCPTYFRS